MAWDRVPRIEVQAGRHGFFSINNSNRVPLGGLITARNLTLADYSWRAGGGASKLGTAIAGTPQIIHAIDYWPTPGRRRTVAVASDGKIYKDDGLGGDWASLVALAQGIQPGGQAIPHLSIAGAEAAGQSRKLFYVDRLNVSQVLVGDAATMVAITKPAADWAGVNQPGWAVAHQGYFWAGGNRNAPHTVYRSLASDHQDFKTQPYTLICGPLSLQQYTVAGVEYTGGLIVGCFPVGTYYIDTSTDLDPLKWTAQLIALPGWAGPHAGGVVEGDVIWMAPDGSWHSLVAAQIGIAKASIRASSLSYQKLTSWPQQNMNLGASAESDLIYYSDRQELMLSYPGIRSAQVDHRLHLDLNNKDEVGPNWVQWDRDLNSCLFLRQLEGGRTIPCFGDYAGQVWLLDQLDRSKAGSAYTAEFLMADTDFSMLFPTWAGRKKNARFLQVEYVATSKFDMTLEVYLDGVKKQTITVTLKPIGAALPATLPFQLGPGALQLTPYERVLGQFTRLAIRGSASVAGGDMNVTRLLLGCELAA